MFAFKSTCTKSLYQYYGSKWISDDGVIKIELFIAEQDKKKCDYSFITYNGQTQMYYNLIGVNSQLPFYRAVDDMDFRYFFDAIDEDKNRYDTYFRAIITDSSKEGAISCIANFHEFLLAFTGSADNIPESLEYTFTLTLVEG